MEFTAAEILARMKADLKNDDTRIEGSFTMDNLQAVAEELARFNSMLIRPLWDEIDQKIEEVITSGNENHYVFWARQVEDAAGNKVVGNARAHGVRDGSGIVYLSLITPEAAAPTDDVVRLVEEYIRVQRPVGAKPIISAAEAVEITVEGTVQLMDGANLEAIQLQAQNDIGKYLTDVAFSRGEEVLLNYHRIGIILGAIPGVKEIVDYTVSGRKDSITAAYSQFFTLGGMTLNAY